ncbi:MAG: caspase family protein [Ferruginibacter sp.]
MLCLTALCFAGTASAQAPQLVIPRGHAEDVSKIAISSDNRLLASGSWDKTVKIWDIASGKELKTLGNYPSWIRSVAFSPDGKLLVTGANKELRVNDLSAGGREIFKQAVHTNDIDALAFSADGKWLVSVSEIDNPAKNGDMFEIKLWNPSGMKLVKKMQGKGSVATLRFEENELLAIGGTQIFHINVNTATITSTEQFETTGISKLSPNGKLIVRDGYDSQATADVTEGQEDALDPADLFNSKGVATLAVIDRRSKQVIHTFKGQKASIKTIAFSPDSRYVVTGADDNTIFIYDLQNMKLSAKLLDKMSYPAGLIFTSDGKKLVSGNYDKVIRIWNFEERKLVQKLGGVANVVYNIALSPNGQSLAVIGAPGFGSGGFIQVLDLKRGAVTKHIDADILGMDVKYSPDGRYMIAGSYDKGIGVWDIATSKKVEAFADLEKATAFAVSPDNNILVYSNRDAGYPEMNVYSFPGGEKINTFSIPHNANTFLFAADSRSVYVGFSSDDKTYRIDIATGKTLQTFRHAGEYNSVTGIKRLQLTKDGNTLITGDDYGHVRWYSVATGKELADSYIQKGRINEMIKMPGQEQLITCGGESAFSDTTITVTDINSKKTLRVLTGHSNSPTSLAADPNGKFLFSGSYDRTVRIWDMNNGRSLATLVFFGGSDWVIVDNAGRFDGTPEGMKKMYYVKGLETIPLESAYEQFYTPNLLPRILEGENFTPTPINIGTLKDAPKVKISAEEMQRNLSVDIDMAMYNATKEQVNIKVQADCPNDGVTEIRLFQNGKLVETTRNLVVEDEKAAEKSAIKTFAVTLSPGENRFKAIAFNTERTESKPAELLVNYKPAANDQPVTATATLHLMVVGINSYKNPKYNLNYALADATSFAEAIKNGSKDLFTNTNTIFIKDADATREGMAAAFEKVKAAAKPQDLFIFYYAGHGVINDKNQFFLAPSLPYNCVTS